MKTKQGDKEMPQEIPEAYAIDEAEAEAAEDTNMEAAQDAPVSSVPLDPAKVNRMAQALSSAFDAITGGEFVIEIGEVQEPVEVLPPEIYGPLTAMSEGLAFASEAGVKDADNYAFDPQAIAGSPDGLTEGYGLFSAMAKDKALIDALSEPPPMEETEDVVVEEAPVPEGEELVELV